MPKGERFYYQHASKVVDGTLCNDESSDVCVDGQCLVSFHEIMFINYKVKTVENIFFTRNFSQSDVI